ncbi:MAG: hypothetical protein ACI93P_002652, partial [bacterium]
MFSSCREEVPKDFHITAEFDHVNGLNIG